MQVRILSKHLFHVIRGATIHIYADSGLKIEHGQAAIFLTKGTKIVTASRNRIAIIIARKNSHKHLDDWLDWIDEDNGNYEAHQEELREMQFAMEIGELDVGQCY